MSETLLKIENLKKSFGKLEVLKGLSTEIRKGEVVVMIGPSGGGKSTFLRCMNLLEQPTEGAARWAWSSSTSTSFPTSRSSTT